MSVKKLLCGAALASLISAPASALDLTIPVANLIDVAQELDFSGNAVGGTLPTISIETDADLPQNNGYRLTINLSGSAAFDGFAASDVSGTGVTGQIVSTGGADGSTTVTILFDVNAALVGTTNPIAMDLPVDITGCASDVSVDIVLEDPSGNVIEGGTAALEEAVSGDPANVVSCVDAFTATFADDGVANELSLVSDFANFLAVAGPPANTTGTASVGSLTVAIDTTAVGADLTTNVAASDVTSIDFDVVLTDDTGITDVETTAGAVAAGSGDDTNAPVYAFTAGTVAAGTSTLTVDVNGTDSVAPQQVQIQNATINFAGAAFIDEAAVVTDFGADSIDLEGASFGPYDWVGDAAKGTANIFRVTGVAATPPSAAVTLVNSSEGVDGTYTLTLDAANVSNGEYLLRASDIEAAAGAPYGRADVTFTFFTSDTLDVDRLLSTGGIVTSYGNAANGDD